MLPRNSKNKGSHRIEPPKNTESAGLTKYQILEKFDTLVMQHKAVKGDDLVNTTLRLRYMLQIVHFYPSVKEACAKDFYFTSLDRPDLLSQIGLGSTASRSAVIDDYLHVGQIMRRYQLDFNKAFDFWVLNNLLREEFKFNSIGNSVKENHKEIYDFADKMTLAKLLELGKKVGFSEQQIRDILPALSTKILGSETKDLTYKLKNNLFAHTGEFGAKMTEAVKNHELRLLNCR